MFKLTAGQGGIKSCAMYHWREVKHRNPVHQTTCKCLCHKKGGAEMADHWQVDGIYVESVTVYLKVSQPGEGGGGRRHLDIPWRSTTKTGVVDPLIGQTVLITILPVKDE